MRLLRVFGFGVAVLSLVSMARSDAAGASPPVMRLEAVDGTSVVGVVRTESVPLTTIYGRVDLPTALITGVRFEGESRVAKVSVVNDDRLSGQIDAPPFRLLSAIGELQVPWKDVQAIAVEKGVTEEAIAFAPVLHRPVSFEIALHDGSRVLGAPNVNMADFWGVFGRVSLPWAHVQNIRFHDDRETCTVRLLRGDTLVGCVNWRGVDVATGLGAVRVSSVHTAEIRVSLGGIDLVEKPHASASGNRYFLGGVKSSSPKIIQGRLRPGSHFIEAHASGRLTFTFDEPIREFRAVLAMWESYCAHKGRVVFKVETEHGCVYTSPPLRNLQHRDVYVRFKPAKTLVLVTDQVGSYQEDWSVWLWPEAR